MFYSSHPSFDSRTNEHFFYDMPLNNSLNSIPVNSSPTSNSSFHVDKSGSNQELQDDSNFIGALKEWAIVCKALEEGNQVLLFRKGGIMEYRNGFELRHKNFFLFPTFEHQSKESIRSEYHKELKELENFHHIKNKNGVDTSLNCVDITSFVEITYFNIVNDIATLEKLEKFHIWNNEYLHTRFNYNPKKPLYLMLLRTYRLNNVFQITDKPEWAGCKSWIQISLNDQELNTYFSNNPSLKTFEYLKSISKPCICDTAFEEISKEVHSIVK